MTVGLKKKHITKSYRTNFYIFAFVIVLLLVGVSLFLDDFAMYNKKILWTSRELKRARANVEWFHDKTGSFPITLEEIKRYAEQNPEKQVSGYDFLRNRLCNEFISCVKGNTDEYHVLNGRGGWFYDPNTGIVKVNLNEPLKHYLKFYFGKERNSIPSDW